MHLLCNLSFTKLNQNKSQKQVIAGVVRWRWSKKMVRQIIFSLLEVFEPQPSLCSCSLADHWLSNGLKALLGIVLSLLVGGIVFDLLSPETFAEYRLDGSFRWSCYYALTLSTTVGYGAVAPEGDAARMAVIVYSAITIPLW